MGLVPPGTEIGVFFKVVLFNIVFFNVASTKSSNIAGILSFGGLLGLIRKRLVDFRLDFLAFIRIDQILTSPSLVDIPPVFVFVQSLRFFGSHSNFLCLMCGGFLLYRLGFVSRAAPCIVRRWVV